uniref:Reverse transcriptase domain-containing protein n=1 Tax=Tanacetum cinerariifolium TaxID=118510 RepID=A0A699L510_TANCI|nr:hypothetical protein [Tanacetum cinerariifolium]
MARAYTTGNNERRGYVGSWPYCNKCKLHHEEPCIVKYRNYNKVRHMTRDCKKAVTATATQRAPVVKQMVGTCFESGRQGHYKKECLKLKNQNRENKSGVGETRSRAYVQGGGYANPDSNVVTGMFFLNNRYASMLFYLGADRSFVSTTFSAVTPLFVKKTLGHNHGVSSKHS